MEELPTWNDFENPEFKSRAVFDEGENEYHLSDNELIKESCRVEEEWREKEMAEGRYFNSDDEIIEDLLEMSSRFLGPPVGDALRP